MTAKKLTPIGDRVIVKPEPEEQKTKSGIVLPDSAKEKPHEGTVIAVGAGRGLDNGEKIPPEGKRRRRWCVRSCGGEREETGRLARQERIDDPLHPGVGSVGPLGFVITQEKMTGRRQDEFPAHVRVFRLPCSGRACNPDNRLAGLADRFRATQRPIVTSCHYKSRRRGGQCTGVLSLGLWICGLIRGEGGVYNSSRLKEYDV